MLPHSASPGLAPPRRRAAVLPERMSHAQTRDRASARTAADCWLSTVQCRNRPAWCGRGRRDRCRAPAGPLPAWSAKERTYRPAEVVGPRRRFALAIELETAGHAVRAESSRTYWPRTAKPLALHPGILVLRLHETKHGEHGCDSDDKGQQGDAPRSLPFAGHGSSCSVSDRSSVALPPQPGAAPA